MRDERAISNRRFGIDTYIVRSVLKLRTTPDLLLIRTMPLCSYIKACLVHLLFVGIAPDMIGWRRRCLAQIGLAPELWPRSTLPLNASCSFRALTMSIHSLIRAELQQIRPSEALKYR